MLWRSMRPIASVDDSCSLNKRLASQFAAARLSCDCCLHSSGASIKPNHSSIVPAIHSLRLPSNVSLKLWGTTKDTMEKNAPATKCTRTSTSEQDDGGPAFAPNRVPALAVDPPAAILPFAGGICTLMLINVSSVRLAFKMRCSNNCHYRLRPVYGFVEAASMTPFEIIRLCGPIGADRLVVQFKLVPVNASDPQILFKSGRPHGEITIHLTAQ
uniref:Major sperm protein n=1 Tax=Parascaris univalens TaxID=6257 RepID=A0A915A6K2_PARUN